MKIKNETVYVIYYNGEPYESENRKIVYTAKGSANGVITTESKEIAGKEYEFEHGKELRCWKASNTIRDELVEKVKERFSVVEYRPVKGS